MITTTSLDDALANVHRHHLEYGPGFSDHAPMVLDALEHSGRGEHIDRWVAGYLPRLDPLTLRTEPEEQRWIAVFDEALNDRDWQDVVAEWVPALVDAFPTAAGHGLLRTAHAARSLGRADTPERRRELAHGLAYWSWRAQRLPSVAVAGSATPAQVLSRLPAAAPADQQGSISARLGRVVTPDFVRGAAEVALPDDPADALTLVTEQAARALRSAGPAGTFAVLHGLTSSIASRDLLLLVSPGDARRLVEAAWLTVAALWVAYGGGNPLVATSARGIVPAADELVVRAVRHGDEHAIKVAVAAWSEERATGDRPEVRAAALAGVEFFGA